MKRSRTLVCLTATALVASGGVLFSAGASAAPAPDGVAVTEWVSDDGGDAGRELPAISADGRFVAFIGRTNRYHGIWVKDRAYPARPPVRVAEGSFFNPAISGDGRIVAYTQFGSGHTGTGQAVYALEWQKSGAEAELVSRADGTEVRAAAGITDHPSVSGDGRYVAFQSRDGGLDEDVAQGQGSGSAKVYVRDRVLGETTMVSVLDVDDGPDVAVDGQAVMPDISADGRRVAFASDAPGLPGVDSGVQQVYVRDLAAGATLPVSVGLAAEATVATEDPVLGDAGSALAYGPSISDDGTKVAFESDAANLVAGDDNGATDAFVRCLKSGTTSLVSRDHTGAVVDGAPDEVSPAVQVAADEGGGKPPEAGGGGEGQPGDTTPNVGLGPVISGDGRFVAFESKVALTEDDENGWTAEDGVVEEPVDVYRVEVKKVPFSIERMSVADDVPGAFEATGYRSDSHSEEEGEDPALIVPTNGADPAIDRDGSSVVFVSNGNLAGRTVPEGTTSLEPAVYLRNTDGEQIVPPAPPPAGGGPVADSTAPVSSTSSPAVSTSGTWQVSYTASDAASGVAAVELFAKSPGSPSYVSAGVDTTDLDGRFRFSSGGVEGDYAFYTVATDKTGNIEQVPSLAEGPDSVTEYVEPGPAVSDQTAPSSKAMSPRFSRTGTFKIRYVARDERAGSGLDKVELFVKAPGAASYSRAATDTGAGIDRVFGYAAAGEGVYRFYTVATDLAGNVEAVPWVADTRIVYDKSPAVLARRMGKGPFVLDLGDRDRLMLRMRINERAQALFAIRHEGKLVNQFGPRTTGKGLVTRYWDGTDLDKKPCEPGAYVLVMKVKDMAGNITTVRTRVRVVS